MLQGRKVIPTYLLTNSCTNPILIPLPNPVPKPKPKPSHTLNGSSEPRLKPQLTVSLKVQLTKSAVPLASLNHQISGVDLDSGQWITVIKS